MAGKGQRLEAVIETPFTRWLAAWAEAHDCSQADIERLTGIKASTQSQWMRGSEPSFDLLRRLAAGLSVVDPEVTLGRVVLIAAGEGTSAGPDDPLAGVPEEKRPVLRQLAALPLDVLVSFKRAAVGLRADLQRDGAVASDVDRRASRQSATRELPEA